METSAISPPPPADLVAVLHALADPVRLEILRQLQTCRLAGPAKELRCGEVKVPVAKSTFTHHVKILVAAGVLAEREEGVRKYLSIRRDEMEERYPGLLIAVLAGAPAPPAS